MTENALKTESSSKDKKNKFFESIPAFLIIFVAVLLPIIFAPLNLISSYSLKTTVLVMVTLLSFFIWLILKLKDNYFKLPNNIFSISIFLIPVLYILSSFFSTNFNVSFFGSNFDSVLNITIIFLMIGLVSILFQSVKNTKYLYFATLFSVFLVTLFHIIKLPLSNIFPTFNFFVVQSSNTIGKWYDLAVFSGIGLVLSIIAIEILSFKKLYKIFIYIISILSIILLSIINFQELWFVIAIVSLLFFIYVFVNNRSHKTNKVPVFSLAVFLISFIFIIAGFRVSPIINNYFGINFIEARPSINVTAEVIKSSISQKPVFGYGPSRFNVAWMENRPSEVNFSDFWNLDFRFGYGFIPTLIINTGILGILPWLLFFGLFLYLGFTSIFSKREESDSKYILISSFVTSLYLWILNIIYIPSIVTLAFTAIFTGVFVASLYREDILKYKKINIINNPRVGFLYIFILILLLISSISAGYVSLSKFIGDLHYQKSINSNNTDQAIIEIINALQFDQNDLYFRTLSGIRNIQLSSVINNQNLSAEQKTEAFQQILTNSVQAAQAAIAYDNSNYLNYINLGSIYESLTSLNIDGVYEQAKDNYLIAKNKNKFNPEVHISLARLEIYNKNYEGARSLIGEALNLKSNYTEAVYLLAKIDILEGKIQEAIAKVEQATLIKPNDPTVYFQLGLLRYENKQYSSAVSAFENAVIRDPYYSNAKYFLGLSYYQLDRDADAIAQFEDLIILNPDNQDLKNILEQIKTGQLIIDDSSNKTVEDLPIEEDKGNEE